MPHVTQTGRPAGPDDALRAMFAARKAVFVDLLKWDVPVIEGIYEIDQFDDAHATYVLLADDRRAHLASARLLPTVRPHILGSLFASLCQIPLPHGDDVHEITRFCLDRSLAARDRRIARDTLVTALVEHALAARIRSYVAVAALPWFRQIRRFGWRCRALGPPQTIAGSTLVALRIEIGADTPARLAAAGITGASAIGVVVRRGVRAMA